MKRSVIVTKEGNCVRHHPDKTSAAIKNTEASGGHRRKLQSERNQLPWLREKFDYIATVSYLKLIIT